MKKILEIDQYWELLNQYQEKIPDMVYNHMMLPGEAASHIEAGKLYYEEQKKGIVFSVKEKDFCKLYFYISEGAEIHLPEKDRPQLIECIYREDKEDIHIQKLRKKTEESGFYPYVKNKRIRAEIQEQDLIPLDKKNIHQNLLWKYASEEEIPAIYKLWEVMDIYNSTIPDEKNLKELLEKKEIITIWKEEKLCGAARVKMENRRTGSIWLITVSRDFRRQGIATALYKVCLSILKEKGCSYVIQWCDEKNQAVLSVSDRFGFQFDGTISCSYICK